MNSSLTPTCSMCGLRFENRPMLELHIREDHPHRSASAEPGHGTPAAAHASASHRRNPASERRERVAASRTKTETSVTGPRRSQLGWAGAGLRRVIGAFRHANADFVLASEIMLRPVIPQPRQPADPPGEPDAKQTVTSGQADRTA
jgi:hypothetical protein